MTDLSRNPARPAAPDTAAAPIAARASVLMVDDQPARLLTYEAILTGLDVQCVRALSGEEALAKLLEQEFAVILLDVNMPGMDGFELARMVRTHPRLEKTPIIFVTAIHGSQIDQLRGYEVGAIDYISIPVVPEILRSKVAVLVELHRRRAELLELNKALALARETLVAEHDRVLGQTRAQLTAIFEHPSETIVVMEAVRDASGAICDWVYRNANSNAEALLGSPRDRLLGRSLREVLPPDRAERGCEICTRVLESGQQMRYEAQYRDTHYLITVFTMGGDLVVSSGVDITDRKRAEAALRESERRYRDSQQRLQLAQQAARIGTHDYDLKQGTIEWDERTRELWGVSPDERVTYDTFLAGVHADDRPSMQAGVDRALDPAGDGQYFATYRVINRRDGTTRWVEATGQAFFEQGRATRFVGTVCDVTDRVIADAKLREADRRKDHFLAMLAHELRNPVAPITSAAEALSQMRGTHEEARTLAGIVQRQAHSLARLLDDLLDVARITQGRIPLNLEVISVETCIEAALETAGPLIRDKRHQLTIGRSVEPIYVKADGVRLAQCLNSLLSNAAKYTKPGGHIRIRPYVERGEAVIEVSDNGEGIAAEFLPHMFELFAQSERALDRSQGGLGIGLCICKQLIEMQGGSVSGTSPGPGQGATFTIRLPVTAATSDFVRSAQTHGAARRVMIVDDNRDAADALAMLLRLEGHEVKTVYGAEQALSCLPEFAPHVALLDIGLPHMNGYELCRRLRESSARGLTLIAISGYGQSEDRERSKKAGFDAHFLKPVELAELRKAMAALKPSTVGR